MENRLVIAWVKGEGEREESEYDYTRAQRTFVVDGNVQYLECMGVNVNILVVILHYSFATGYHWDN